MVDALIVTAVSTDAIAFENDNVLPVTFVTVVLPSVELPVVKIFPNAPVPETVVEPTLSAVSAPVPPVKLVSVVEASVDDPDTTRFANVAVLIVSVFAASEPVTVRLDAVVDARVEDPVVRMFVAFRVATFEVEALVVVANTVVRYEVPVAFTCVKLPVPEFVIFELFVLAFNVVKLPVTAVIALAINVVNAPIPPVIFVTVVLPRVDEPVVKKLAATSVPVFVEDPTLSDVRAPFCATKFAIVVDASVVLPPVKFVTKNVVDVPFVRVALVAVKLVGLRVEILKFVIVALVSVALVPIRFVTLLVEAFDVDASTVVN